MGKTLGEDDQKRTTLAEVAAAAGVSVPTVSKVLNGRPDVASGTRTKVERMLDEQGYVPAAARRSVPATRTVGLVLDDLTTSYAIDVIRGVTDAGWDLGVDIVIGRLRQDGPRSRVDGGSWAKRLRQADREGVLVVTAHLTDRQLSVFSRAGLPVILIDPLNETEGDIPSVGATNWTGGSSAAEHLVDLGHERIGFIGGPVLAECSRARLHGYRAALERGNIDVPTDLIEHGTFHYRDAYALALKLLDRPDAPTAIFAANDEMAVGVIQAAYGLGLRVPDDLSVVGFDDTSLASWTTPPLTTVRAPLADMGRIALRSLLQLIDGQTLDSNHIQLATRLIVRDSSAPPKA